MSTRFVRVANLLCRDLSEALSNFKESHISIAGAKTRPSTPRLVADRGLKISRLNPTGQLGFQNFRMRPLRHFTMIQIEMQFGFRSQSLFSRLQSPFLRAQWQIMLILTSNKETPFIFQPDTWPTKLAWRGFAYRVRVSVSESCVELGIRCMVLSEISYVLGFHSRWVMYALHAFSLLPTGSPIATVHIPCKLINVILNQSIHI